MKSKVASQLACRSYSSDNTESEGGRSEVRKPGDHQRTPINPSPVIGHTSLAGAEGWRFVNTGRRRGKLNMEYDEYLAKRLLDGSGEPTVRVYGWEPYAISLGYHQKMTDIDTEKCRGDGIDIVRRPTGGRAILHAHELTYSVAMHSEGMSVAQAYEYIGEALVVALRYLGVQAEMSRGELNFSELYGEMSSVSCFASTSRSEIQYRGKKIVGSAQRRYGNVVLQHGSVLLGSQHRRFVEYLSPANLRILDTVQRVLEYKTIDVESILQRPVSFDDAADAVRRGFEDACGIKFIDEVLVAKRQETFAIDA